MSRPVVVAAAAVAALAVLAGCGGPTEPSPPPTSQDALTTPTTQPDDVEETTEAVTSPPDDTAATETESVQGPPEMPDAAREQTEEGAEAFVEHYIDALDYAYANGSVAHMDELASPQCQSCSALLTDLPSNPDGAPTFASDEIAAEVLGAGLARVEATVSVLRGAGEGQGILTFDLSEQTSGWLIDGIRLQEGP